MTAEHGAGVINRPFWLDSTAVPGRRPAIEREARCSLAVVGGGFAGLWTALIAKQRDLSREVVLLEAGYLAEAASGRNGGFCDASLTHGITNGLTRFPDELEVLEQLGMQNLDGIESQVAEFGIDCGFERTGKLRLAVDDWQLGQIAAEAEIHRRFGHDVEMLDAKQVKAEVMSPTYLGGLRIRDRCALLDPARLAWGLADACERLGVRIFEQSRVVKARVCGSGMELRTKDAAVYAQRVALTSGVSTDVLRRIGHFVLPVYDYVIVTESLSAGQRDRIGWRGRQGLSDAGHQFHYYRLTEDDRILFGGYDAVYHFGNRVGSELESRPASFERLREHLYRTFPQLGGIEITHHWGGAIDTCSRFSAFWGSSHRGRMRYCAGFTGLGVGATRFAATVLLDLLDGRDTELTRLEMVRRKPLPFPPEPLRSAVVGLTTWSRAEADRNGGKENLWLRTLNHVGLGFDS